MIAGVATLLVLAQVDVNACRDAPPQCRQAAGAAILVERTIAETRAVDLETCMTKLGARTSTVIERLVPVPNSSVAAPSGHSTEVIIAALAIAAVLFAAIGYGLGTAAGDEPQTVVVR